MEQRPKVNSSEIARIAGVSRATVSRVINNTGNVKPETVDRVMRVVQRFSYTPNLQAQVLAGKSSNTIGLFFITYTKEMHAGREDIHLDFMISMIINAASANGFYVLVSIVSDPPDDPVVQSRIRDMFAQNRIDAGIFIGFPNYFGLIEELVASGYVVGAFDQNIVGRNEPNRIVVNIDSKPIEDAMDYLVSLGHRRIMCVHGDLNRFSGADKYTAFQHSLEKHKRYNIYSPPEWQLFTQFSGWSTRPQMDQFLKKAKELPTAICCANDAIAFGVIDVLKLHGLRVPDDISVTGSDNITLSQFLTPALTTSHIDFHKVLYTLTESVIGYLQKPLERQFRAVFSSEFIIRDSCKKI